MKQTIKDLHQSNIPYLKYELSSEALEYLTSEVEKYCNTDDVVNTYIDLYNKALKLDYNNKQEVHQLESESVQAIYLTINQQLFDNFTEVDLFYNYVFNLIKESYRTLENYKVFSIQIDNIYHQNKNIKWDLYAYFSIYAETLNKRKEKQKHYKPELLCFEMLEPFNIKLKHDTTQEELINELKIYYLKQNNIKSIYNKVETDLTVKQLEDFILQWAYIYEGFTYHDALIMQDDKLSNKSQINDMTDNNFILLVFYKYRLENRKIPCPECGSLNVTSNSFVAINNKSWLCNNSSCEFKANNKGNKRFNARATYMQRGAKAQHVNDLMTMEYISKWKHDVTTITDIAEVIEMFIRYYTFSNEKILFINNEVHLTNIATTLGRKVKDFDLFQVYPTEKAGVEKLPDIYEKLNNNGEYVSRFIVNKHVSSNFYLRKQLNEFVTNPFGDIKIINSDNLKVLTNLNSQSINAIVTSPPYYNSRVYSEWNNFYLYLIDMYNIIKQSKEVLKNDGIIMWNIADIIGLENIILRKTELNRKLLLSAYSILLFKQAGFELVENIVWYKGHLKSKRNNNFNNLTSHYQKCVNAYEHLLVFKKADSNININDIEVDTFINTVVHIRPTKIGKSRYGHSAPFPAEIPDFICKKFLNNNKESIVLDPFSGSATTPITSAKNGYKGVGIELKAEYIEGNIDRAKDNNLTINTLKF